MSSAAAIVAVSLLVSASTDHFPAVGGIMSSARPSPIAVDQFGYLPGDPKVAVIGDEVTGDAGVGHFTAGPRYELRRLTDGATVLAGRPVPWHDGAEHQQSGNRGWWFDFSAVAEPGTYRVVDVERGVSSAPFEIADDVYDALLKTALRVFWFNRANTPHPPELAGPWSDEAAFVGPGQDTEARSIDAPDDQTTARDLRGGWFDAGDTNKYVTFAAEPVHVLLAAYRNRPGVFGDDVGIPESGNGVPDVLDEVAWELDWLARMQLDDGAVLTKVGITQWATEGIPSKIDLPRYYEEACSSAAIAAAGMFAHAAFVGGEVPGLEDRAAAWKIRARRAWEWYLSAPKREDCDPQVIKAGDADWPVARQRRAEVVAAAYLYLLTGDKRFEQVVRSGFRETRPFIDEAFGRYSPEEADALLAYCRASGADPEIVAALDARIAGLVASSDDYGTTDRDLYRAFMPDAQYHWGSNRVKASTGTANLLVPVDGGRARALDHLHWFHGVNPHSLVYLTNMGELGAEHSVRVLYHFWFGNGSAFDVTQGSDVGVAPGYVVGGPNHAYSGKDVPPAGQPPQKSYRDWSPHGGDPSWEITEPSIAYQAAYVRLLSGVMEPGTPASTASMPNDRQPRREPCTTTTTPRGLAGDLSPTIGPRRPPHR